MASESSNQDQEFADKAVERRKRERRERDEQEEGHQHGHRRGQAAELLDFESVAAVVEHANAEKKRAGGDSVIEHLVDRALNRDGIERENAEDHKAEVADRGVGHEALQIRLHGG